MSDAPPQIVPAPKQVADPTGTAQPQLIDTSKGKEASKDAAPLQNAPNVPPPTRPVMAPAYRGWKEVGGYRSTDQALSPDLTHQLMFEDFLPAAAYGDWYHHVGFLIGAGLLLFIVGWFRFLLAPVFFIMVAVLLVYRVLVRSYRSSLRTTAQREFTMAKIELDMETMDWFNNILEKFWPRLEPSISQIVCEQANAQLATNPAIPKFIQAVWVDTFTLGTKPFRVDKVRTHTQGLTADVVVMDWGFSFTPNALADADAESFRSRVNMRMVIKVKVFGITIPISVADTAFLVNRARIRVRMIEAFPNIDTVNILVMEPPQFDFSSRVGGDTIFNWEVLAIPGLFPLINEMVLKYVGPLLFSPMSFQLNIQQLLSGAALDSAIGVLAVTATGAAVHGDSPDPYLVISTAKSHIKTAVVKNSNRPAWKTVHYILVQSLLEPLALQVFDYNEFRKDRPLGEADVDLEQLLSTPTLAGQLQPLVKNNKRVGSVLYDLRWYPTLEAVRKPDGSSDPPPDLNTGISRIVLEEVRGLKDSPTTYAELYVGKEKVAVSKPVKANAAPVFSLSHELLVKDRRKTRVLVAIKDKKTDKTISKTTVSLNALLDAAQVDNTWFPLDKGEVRITPLWKPVALGGAAASAGYTDPIGCIRVGLSRAEDLRNLEVVGKLDPYFRLLVNGLDKARTAMWELNLDPVINEVHYIPITLPNQKLTIEAMDFEPHSRDRTLGLFELVLGQLIARDKEGKFVEYIENKERAGKLIHKQSPKGAVFYNLSFYPTLPVMLLEEILEYEEEEDEKYAEWKKEEHAEGETYEKAKPPKAVMELNQLELYSSGVFVYTLEAAKVLKECHLQVYFDGDGFPLFTLPELSPRKKAPQATGDLTVRDLDFSQCILRLVKKPTADREDECIGELSIPTRQILRNAYSLPQEIKIGADLVTLRARYVPLLMSELPAADSFENAGNLTIEVVSATGLPSADRNGKLDPYVHLLLDNNKPFFKSKTKKRTLDPVWNETASVEVTLRDGCVLRVQVNDWDMGPEDDDRLGFVKIPLSEIDPNSAKELTLDLESDDGAPAGSITVVLRFKASFVVRTANRAKTSGLGGGAKALTGVAGSGIGAGKKVLGAPIKGVKGLFKKSE